MGTSNSFSGSSGKDAGDLRDNIAAWLDAGDRPEVTDGTDSESADGAERPSDKPRPGTPGQPRVDLVPALRVLINSRGGHSDGHGGAGGGSRGGGGGRPSGGVTRSVGRVSRAAGRAGILALAYSSGNREALREAGLNYDELQSLGDPVAVGLKIVETAFETQADSTLADAEERDIVATVVEWILEQPEDHSPTPEDVVRKSIETMIAETALTEVSATIYARDVSFEMRRHLERQIRDVAAEYAAQATLNPGGATEQQMAQAIENGIRDIGQIFGVTS
ncbi:hypothetical protein HMPREF1531_00029 [Propionibacterium sp. oral taxon 192 str. F0372]|uniref:hypothetical protein n=1 Tax=Propionibacterium sp. oral taxon 192 TaxID=671222 RepID=UPI000353D5D2|nr:hypothetical protein [Propionibacterium sp. oral taxon 192]EPH06985.1 hypothetical protein HMPREF1531_00029 [Propionibacterium sp. oral taxon 192 str. F0372]